MKRINYVFLAVVMGIITAGSLVSCKDYEEDLRSELQGTKSVLEALKGTVEGAGGIQETLDNAVNVTIPGIEKDLEEAIKNGNNKDKEQDDAIAALEQTKATKDELKAVNDALNQHIEAAKKELEKLNANDADHLKRIIDLEAKTTEALSTANQAIQIITDLTSRVKALEDWKGEIETWKGQIETWKTTIDNKVDNVLPAQIKEALDSATAVATIAKVNAATLEEHKKQLEALGKADEDTNARIDSLIKEHNEVIEAIDKNINTIDSVIGKMKDRADALEEHVYGTLQDVIGELGERVAQLEDDIELIADLQDRVTKLEEDVADLLGRVDKIENYLNQFISGILIQGVHNSIYGSYALPNNIQNNLLAAYYGDFTSGVEFPTADPVYYVSKGSTVLSQEDLNMLGITSEQLLPGTVTGSAGKVYVTINPTSRDFTGAQFELVNSLDQPSGVTLAPAQQSEKKLTFGWTRAGAAGFYEVEANIEDVEKVKANIDLDNIKAAVKDVIDRKDGINVTNVVATIYNSFNDVLDANALKATYTDPINEKEVAIYSQFAIGATAVKPLSYQFGMELDVNNVPGFDKMESLVNKVFDKISIPELDFDQYEFTKIDSIKLNSAKDSIKADVEIVINIPAGSVFEADTITVTIGSGSDEIIIPANKEYRDTIKTTVPVYVGEIFDGIENDVNSFVQNINDQLQSVNDLIKKADKINDVLGKVDSVEGKLISFLDKLNSGFCKVINNAYRALQPTMLVCTTDGYARLSGVQKSPTLVNGTEISLVPTSYTADLLAPAYKRLVGVTNVYNASYTKNAQKDGGDLKAELDRVNNQEIVGEVVAGTKDNVKVTLAKGYVYEFVYTSVDYSGKVAAKKYYIAVK